MTKISDIAQIISVSIKNPSECGFDRYVGLEHYDSGEPMITRFGSTELLTTNVKHFKAGDVLLARRNVNLRRAGLVDFEGITSGDSIVLRPNSAEEGAMLPFILNTTTFWDWAEANSDGTMSKRLSPKVLVEYEFALPPLAEQKVLAEKLWAAYRLKESYKKMIEATDEMVKSQFIEMFGDPQSNPKGWPTMEMRGTSFLLSDGPFGSNLKSEHYRESGIRVIRLQNICRGYYDDTDKAFVSVEHYEKLKRYTCKPGEIVIGTLGEPNLRACIIPEFVQVAINKADCVHYIPKEDLINTVFACGYINSEEVLKMATKDIHGTTRARIAAGQIAKLPIYLPPITLQNEFEAISRQADKSKFELRKSIEAIDKVIKSLINNVNV